jgi:hypothetical protein
MNEVHKLIRQIRDYLAGSTPAVAVEMLAADYSRACADAVARLDTCAAMLAKGSEYQALQLAETEPPLLDLLAALSFADARKWADACAKLGLPFAPPFDQRAVDALDALYRRGVSANHPLYRDYRAAVTARDDTRALGIIRSIARLNPADANAKTELTRLENKAFQALKTRLHASLETGDEPGTLATLDELERIPAARDLPGTADFERAVALRRTAHARVAAAEAAQAAGELAGLRESGDWRGAAAVTGRIASLAEEHGFVLTGESDHVVQSTRAWVDRERAAAEETARFEAAVSRLNALSAEAGARLRARQPLSAGTAAEMLLTLERAWKEVEGFGRPVSDEILNAARTSAAAVRAERQRLQRARMVKTAVLTAAALVVVSAAGWWWWRAQSASDFQQQLAQLEAGGEVEPAERLAASLLSERPGLAARPQLHAQLEKTTAWARDSRRSLADADGLLAAIEKHSAARFASVEPSALASQLDIAGGRVMSLPKSLRPAMQSRLDAVRTTFEGWVATQRETLARSAETELAHFESAVQEKLRLDAPADALAAAMGELEPAFRAFDARVNPPHKALALPAALATRFTAVRQRANLIGTELDTLARCREGLLKAADLDAYRAALDAFKVSQLTASPEVQAAGKLAAQFPSTDALLAALLIPDDPVAWQAVKQEAADPWKPKDVLEAELNGFFALRDDPLLNSIHEATVVGASGVRRKVFTQGKIGDPSETGDAVSKTRSWSGKFFDSKDKLPGIHFGDATYTLRVLPAGRSGEELTDIRESAVTQAFRSLDLERMTDADGAKYELPLLRQFERVASLTKTPPSFRAYLLWKLAYIANFRPNSWGLHHCRSLRADLAELRSLTADSAPRSSDWLMPARDAALKPLIERCATRKYYAEARATRSILTGAMKAGLKLGGYVDAAGNENLRGEARAGFALWTLDENARPVALAGRSAHPLAPVFYVPVRTADLLAAAKVSYEGELPAEVIGKIPLAAAKP